MTLTMPVASVYQPGLTQPRPSIVEGEALVMFKKEMSASELEDFCQKHEVELKSNSRSYTLVGFEVKDDPEKETRAKIEQLKKDELVAVAETNGVMYPAKNPGFSPGGFGPGMLM